MGKNLSAAGALYGAWKTDYGVWMIQTANVTMYLIEGEKKALLIDTGYGEGDLAEVVKGITDLPLIVADTHGHLDHSGGNAFFEEVWMGKGGEEPALSCKVRKKLPNPDYKINFLEDGMVFDLGGRQIEAIAIGAHHRSSFAFLDRQGRTLFTGDELESGQVLLCVHDEDVSDVVIAERHRKNMLKLKGRTQEFDRLAPAHNGGPLELSYIDDFIELATQVMEGRAYTPETCAGFGWPADIFGGDKVLKRVKYKKASFIMRK